MIRFGCLVLMLLAPLGADGLHDLRAVLGMPGGRGTQTARVRFELLRKQRDGSRAYDCAGQVEVRVEAGPEGLRVAWPPELLAKVRGEERQFDRDRVPATPAIDTFRDLRPELLVDLLDYRAALLEDLEGCRILEDRAATLEGRTLRCLALEKDAFRCSKNPRLDEPLRWALKSVRARYTLWVGPDGMPVALEELTLLKGRMFWIGFEVTHQERLSFTSRGGRLLVSRLEVEDRGAGSGQSASNRRIYTLAGD